MLGGGPPLISIMRQYTVPREPRKTSHFCGLAGLLARTDRIHRVADRQKRLERHHRFVVFGEVTGDHQDFLRAHRILPLAS